MVTSETPVCPHSSVVFTRLDATEAVLLHLDTKRYYSVNETGARVWELLQDGTTPARIAAALQEDYLVDSVSALAAVQAFLRALSQEGLVQMRPSSQHA